MRRPEASWYWVLDAGPVLPLIRVSALHLRRPLASRHSLLALLPVLGRVTVVPMSLPDASRVLLYSAASILVALHGLHDALAGNLFKKPQCRAAIGHGPAQALAQIPFHRIVQRDFEYAAAHRVVSLHSLALALA